MSNSFETSGTPGLVSQEWHQIPGAVVASRPCAGPYLQGTQVSCRGMVRPHSIHTSASQLPEACLSCLWDGGGQSASLRSTWEKLIAGVMGLRE